MSCSKYRILSYTIALALINTSNITLAAAHEENLPTTVLEDVTVTASGFEEAVRTAPASVSIITAEEIENLGYTDLRQVLAGVHGVDTMGSTGRFDTPAISIRGLDDSYTLIMIDGVAHNGPGIAGGMMRSFNQIANTSLPSVSQIERIEIIRGPMSTLYGSDAMGGVINIITKKVDAEFSGSINVGSLFETDDNKKNMQRYAFNISGPITREKVGLQLRGNYLKRSSSTYGIERDARDYDNWNIGTRITWTPTAASSYYLDVDRAQNTREGGFSQRMPIGALARGDVEQRFDRDRFALNAENKLHDGTLTSTLSFIRNEMNLRANLSASPNPLMPAIRVYPNIRNNVINDILNYDVKYVTDINDDHRFTVGGRIRNEKIDYSIVRRITTSPGAPPPIVAMANAMSSNSTGNLSRTNWALFAEDTWDIASKLTFTYGLRYDHPEDFDDNLSPRGYLVYAPDDNFTIKGGIATGYKSPSLLQSSPVDVVLNVTNQIYRGNANLKPEKSVTKEVGVYYNNAHNTSAHLTLFHTDFKNKIELSQPVGIVRTYENIGKARIHGIELGTNFTVAPRVTANLNYTFITSRQKNGSEVGRPLRSTPKNSVNLKFNWAPAASTDIWLAAHYRQGMYRSTQTAGLSSYYHPFTIANMGVSHKLKKDLTVHFNVNNLFNKNFDRRQTVGGSAYSIYYDDLNDDGIAGGSYFSGRSYWLGLSYEF